MDRNEDFGIARNIEILEKNMRRVGIEKKRSEP
jgi:hypothetical protein